MSSIGRSNHGGIKVKKGSAQDATFITADPGHEKHNDPRIVLSRRRTTRHSLVASHTVVDVNKIRIVGSYAVTTAKDHDAAIDLSKTGITVYRDKGYFGNDQKGINGTLDRAMRGYKTTVRIREEESKNLQEEVTDRIPIHRDEAGIHFDHVLVTLIRRVSVKFMFACFAYTLSAVDALGR